MIIEIPKSLDKAWCDLFHELVITPVKKEVQTSEHIGSSEFFHEIIFHTAIGTRSVFLV